MKRGFYFIVTDDIDKDGNSFMKPTLAEGSYEHYGKLMVHRCIDNEGKRGRWKVSHIESGAAACCNKTLSEARSIAKKLQGFKLWDLETWDDLSNAIKLHHLGYQEEVKMIRDIIR